MQSDRSSRQPEAQQALGEYQIAARSLQRGLLLAKQLGDDLRMASILGALGNIHIALGVVVFVVESKIPISFG